MKKTIFRALSTAALLSTVYAGSALADTYQVQKGDNLSKIASKYQTSVNELKTLNSLQSDLIYINQTLKISASTVIVQPSQSSTYIVVKGDCLSKIATRYKVTVNELKQWNNLNTTIIYVGQALKISTQTPTPAPTPTKPAPVTQAPTSQYTIKSGDTLSKIGELFKMTVQQLKTLNNLTSDRIYVGQKLKVSGSAGTPAPTPTPTPAPAPQTDFAAKTVAVAKSLIGVPYVWGGTTPSGFDCSGFIYYVTNQAGKKVVRTSAAGYYDRSYYVDQPKAGDIVFFENTYKKGISHLGIYLGNNQFIHANDGGVMISNLTSTYYKAHFSAFKRFY